MIIIDITQLEIKMIYIMVTYFIKSMVVIIHYAIFIKWYQLEGNVVKQLKLKRWKIKFYLLMKIHHLC